MLQAPPSFQIPIRILSSSAQAAGLQESELHSVLGGSGLEPIDLYPGNQESIPGEVFFEIMERIRGLRESPTINLDIGANTQLSVMWPLNEYFLNAPDLYSAMSAPPEYQPLRVPFLRSKLSLEADYLKIELLVFVDVSEDRLQGLSEVYFQIIQTLAHSYIGEEIPDCYFEFRHKAPDYQDAYQDYFHGHCYFGKNQNCYYIPIDYARKANPKANADAYQLAQTICQQQLKQVPNHSLTMADRVCRTLMSQPLGKMHEDAVARALFVSKRTLARRLEGEGKKFRQVREELLSELASRQLRESQASVESIAVLLGYSDVANFRRAFKRWFSKSPSEYRQSFQNSGSGNSHS
ncbi:helix-turn-helix domain-containing protein [Pseudoteredinibacter isoporae]|uniref:AraC-like DNA-binding protein n=1 Tax=Pseudoteredinibacter isoporae TaxID=570281 RepID=A0A7X0JT72_9GAMM|nr:AraC family transcriptional regulator [Pseudoteredinibacter isoporae]MBB6521825.1 AraC-like DNA-binding protein [Pseudoteredinibacter isoporae]NHO87370.1 AraC family transcriptional regulator [Pseudoteredinibacter isoporae]NIB23194.1 AraC family transcriptional regulator [Pseudoteredinibacter isoporae]